MMPVWSPYSEIGVEEPSLEKGYANSKGLVLIKVFT